MSRKISSAMVLGFVLLLGLSFPLYGGFLYEHFAWISPSQYGQTTTAREVLSFGITFIVYCIVLGFGIAFYHSNKGRNY